MANTYTSIFYHLVFSTKNREPWLIPKIEQRVWSYLGGVARAHQVTPIQIGGVEDHGYGGFSVSRSDVSDVVSYIQNQREHHRRKTFKDEYVELLVANGIEFDERYLWG